MQQLDLFWVCKQCEWVGTPKRFMGDYSRVGHWMCGGCGVFWQTYKAPRSELRKVE